MAAALTLGPIGSPGRAEAAQSPIEAACAKWAPLMRANGLPVKTFTRICYRESRGVARAIGWNYKKGKSHKDCRLSPARTYRKCAAVRSFDLGIFQINSTWVTVTMAICKPPKRDIFILLKPECNAKVAGHLYRNGGLNHWRATSGPGN